MYVCMYVLEEIYHIIIFIIVILIEIIRFTTSQESGSRYDYVGSRYDYVMN